MVKQLISIDEAHLLNQRMWSEKTFGPGKRTKGIVDHISKELKEILEDPEDLKEWVDVIILAFDGAWRAGYTPYQILMGIKLKQLENEKRLWPDWTTMSENEAIEHVKEVL